VAIDAISIVPVFLSFTTGVSDAHKKELITSATLTAFLISSLFLIAGRLVFEFLGITENDFRIGGGIVLLVLSVTDLLFGPQNPADRIPPVGGGASLGVVPLGIPLIMGPTALTSVLMVSDSYGYTATFIALVANLFFVWLVFRHARYFAKVMGEGGAKALSKITSLFLAAIAVMMIRIGLSNILGQH
jgi:multiple antibiotic resistance protein